MTSAAWAGIFVALWSPTDDTGMPRVQVLTEELVVVTYFGQFARASSADAVALLPPHFYPLAQADLVEFFVRAGEAADLPVFLYNFPERTGNRISLETIGSVADRVRLAGVNQSGGEFEYHRALVEL